MNEKKIFVAIELADNGTCKRILDCQNISEEEYQRLHDQESINKGQESTEKALLESKIDQMLHNIEEHNFLIAKSIYDNLVDRGEIADDLEFEHAWYDYIVNGVSFSIDYEYPSEFKKILERVANL